MKIKNCPVKHLPFAALSLFFMLAACATTPKDNAGRSMTTVPQGYQSRVVKCGECPAGSYIIEPIFRTKLEILRDRAVFKNNRLTAEIAAGTAAAVAAYAGMDLYYKSRNEKPNPYFSLAATAGSAYAAAAIAGVVYDMFASRKTSY